MTDSKIAFGKQGEDKACEYLSAIGYEVLDRNYETYSGEIDIVALDMGEAGGKSGRKTGTLVFAE